MTFTLEYLFAVDSAFFVFGRRRSNASVMDTTEDGRMSEASSARNRGRRRSIASPMIDDMDAAHGPSAHGGHIRPQLRCNACWDPVLPDPQSAQTCYRTSCSHLFCVSVPCSPLSVILVAVAEARGNNTCVDVDAVIQEKCAYKHFGAGRLVCPACRTGGS